MDRKGTYRLFAFDLDGTLTQHKTPLGEKNRALLDRLGEEVSLLMVGAGQCRRIFHQLEQYPIDIIGNYGMQFCRYDKAAKDLKIVYDEHAPCDRESVEERISALREEFGYTDYRGNNVEFHPSGCVTFPILGTEAQIGDKLAFDPDRVKRRAVLQRVREVFPEYTVFIGGSSSFDFAPLPFNKYYALDRYCRDFGLSHSEVVYVGDDYGPGGNDEGVYRSDFSFICVDDYTCLGEAIRNFLQDQNLTESLLNFS